MSPSWVVTIKNSLGPTIAAVEITVRLDSRMGVESEDAAISAAMQEVRWFAPHLHEGPNADSMREAGALKVHRA